MDALERNAAHSLVRKSNVTIKNCFLFLLFNNTIPLRGGRKKYVTEEFEKRVF